MKKIITMFLLIAIAISSITTPADTAKADTDVTESTDTDIEPIVSTELTSVPEPTVQPEQKQMKIKIKEEKKAYADGKTVPVTKGFTLTLSLKDPKGDEDYQGAVKWTSNKPDTVSVNADGIIKGKKIGKAAIIAEYNGVTTSIVVKVKKNKLTYKPKKYYTDDPRFSLTTPETAVIKGAWGITSVYFDKNGNIVYTYYQKNKLTKSGKECRKAMPNWIGFQDFNLHYMAHANGCTITIKNQQGTVVAKTRQKILILHAFKNKDHVTNVAKFKILKKDFKKKQKDIDLRRCKIYIDGDSI